MSRISRKDYSHYERGKLTVLYCKVCGEAIARLGERFVDTSPGPAGKIIEKYTESFVRGPNYIEAKMVFNDGSGHITHGCTKCLSEDTDLETLRDMYVADLEHMGLAVDRDKKVVGMVALRIGGGIA